VNFEDLNWDILDRLRATFLEGKPVRRAYWTSDEDLAQYDVTYGERIGWKWDAVLADLRDIGWTPPAAVDRVLDWGCGSGVAGRRVLQAYPTLRTLQLHDRSPCAVNFAARRAREAIPGVAVHPMETAPDTAHGALVVLSHVCNELDPRAEARLLSLVTTASAVLWVEPGTHAVSRRLQGFRERLKDSHDIIAPCTHAASCPLLARGRERDWCHQFATPPPRAFTDGHWVRFARRAGIDLRSLPFAWLVLGSQGGGDSNPGREAWSRVVGRLRVGRNGATGVACSSSGIEDLQITRDAWRSLTSSGVPETASRLRRERIPPLP